MSLHSELISLIIAYTLTGAFVFTVIITCLSLVGWVKFADQNQQKKLFGALILEVVVICVGSFAGFLNFSAQEAQSAIATDAINAVNQFSVPAPDGYTVFRSPELGLGFAYPSGFKSLETIKTVQLARLRSNQGNQADVMVQTTVLPARDADDRRSDSEYFDFIVDKTIAGLEQFLANFKMTKREPYPVQGKPGYMVTFAQGQAGAIEMKFVFLLDAAHGRVHQFNVGGSPLDVEATMPTFRKILSTVVFPPAQADVTGRSKV